LGTAFFYSNHVQKTIVRFIVSGSAASIEVGKIFTRTPWQSVRAIAYKVKLLQLRKKQNFFFAGWAYKMEEILNLYR